MVAEKAQSSRSRHLGYPSPCRTSVPSSMVDVSARQPGSRKRLRHLATDASSSEAAGAYCSGCCPGLDRAGSFRDAEWCFPATGPRRAPSLDGMLGLPDHVRACLFDLDGVLTQTAGTHAAAWKEMFDGYLRERAAREWGRHQRGVRGRARGRRPRVRQDPLGRGARRVRDRGGGARLRPTHSSFTGSASS